MPTRKIADLPNNCMDKDHNPPMHVYLENGVYEHTCPLCGKKQIFTVNKPTLSVEQYDDENPYYITGTEDGI